MVSWRILTTTKKSFPCFVNGTSKSTWTPKCSVPFVCWACRGAHRAGSCCSRVCCTLQLLAKRCNLQTLGVTPQPGEGTGRKALPCTEYHQILLMLRHYTSDSLTGTTQLDGRNAQEDCLGHLYQHLISGKIVLNASILLFSFGFYA